MKKNRYFLIIFVFVALLLAGCHISILPGPTTTTSTATTSSTSSTSTSQSGFNYSGEGLKIIDDLLKEDFAHNLGIGIPSTGSRKALVIPIEFKPYQIMDGFQTINYGSFNQNDLDKMAPGFNGDYESTGYESVHSFYYKSSYGALDLSFDIADVYTLSKTFLDYQNDPDDGARVILKEVLRALDSEIDFSQYDTNDDGYIDGVYLVYSIPYGGSPNEPSAISNLRNYNEDYWWAWVDWAKDTNVVVDGVRLNYFMWASVDFFNDKYDANGTKSIPVNATTFIHETGHMLGLEDYYDYKYDYEVKNGKVVPINFYGGTGGADMMDGAVGDHSAVSKILLGWLTPTVVQESGTYNLVSLQEIDVGVNHQVLLIPKNWHDSYFDEYYLVDFYTPTGLNYLQNGEYGLFSSAGVRVYHIDARVSGSVGHQFDMNYWTYFSYNNSTTDHLFIKLMEGDGDASLEKLVPNGSRYYPADATNSDLFYEGNTFDATNTWYDGTNIDFTISIDAIDGNVATVTVTK